MLLFTTSVTENATKTNQQIQPEKSSLFLFLVPDASTSILFLLFLNFRLQWTCLKTTQKDTKEKKKRKEKEKRKRKRKGPLHVATGKIKVFPFVITQMKFILLFLNTGGSARIDYDIDDTTDGHAFL